MEGKMKIAVVEDEKVHAAVLTGFLEAWLKENKVEFCIREFPNAAAFLFEWEQDQACLLYTSPSPRDCS